MRRVKMHDRDVNNSGRHGASRPSETRGHMNSAWRKPPPRFLPAWAIRQETCNRVAVHAPWSVRHRGVFQTAGSSPHTLGQI